MFRFNECHWFRKRNKKIIKPLSAPRDLISLRSHVWYLPTNPLPVNPTSLVPWPEHCCGRPVLSSIPSLTLQPVGLEWALHSLCSGHPPLLPPSSSGAATLWWSLTEKLISRIFFSLKANSFIHAETVRRDLICCKNQIGQIWFSDECCRL